MTNPPGSALVAPEPEARKPAPLTESVSVAVAAQAKAAVEARYLMAIRQPRSWLNVRSKLLEACHRPAFAASARYRKPIGGGSVEGASIRFAEEALRCMTNVYVEVAVMYEDETQRIVRVTPTDLEANVSYPTDIIIAKTVERKKPRDGADIIGSRVNTQGGTVYLVRATEDELVTKQAAMVSKAIRTSGLRLLPSDIHEEAMDACIATEANADAQDPKAAMKKLADAFDSIGVRPSELEKFLAHPLDQTSPAEIRRLRAFWRAIEEGEATAAQLAALPPERWAAPVYAGGPGPTWSVRDVAAHLLTSERALRAMIADVAVGGCGAPLSIDIDAYNAAALADIGPLAPDEILAGLARERAATAGLVAGLTGEQLDWLGRHPALGEIALEEFVKTVYRHAKIHLRDVLRT